MSYGRVEICNYTLAKLGHEDFITDFEENSKAARYFRKLYNITRDSLLRRYLWRFAVKRVILSPLVGEPAFDGGKYFQLPTDCLRVIGVDEASFYGRLSWRTEGDKILAHTDTLKIVYISRVEDESLFDSIFVECFTDKLASDIAIGLTQSYELRDAMQAAFMKNVVMAAHVGATEQDSQKIISETFLEAR